MNANKGIMMMALIVCSVRISAKLAINRVVWLVMQLILELKMEICVIVWLERMRMVYNNVQFVITFVKHAQIAHNVRAAAQFNLDNWVVHSVFVYRATLRLVHLSAAYAVNHA